MPDQDRRATWARFAPLAEVLAPVLLSAVAFRGILGVSFHLDDHVHLYDIVNFGPQSILINFAGHMYLTRNTVMLLLHALFGMNAPATMAVVLLNHLVAVALMVVVIRTLTGNGAVASVVAAWWGANAMNTETVGWYSVYGQVLVITAVLSVLLLAARLQRGDPVTKPAAVAALLALLAAATSFGTGLAVTLVMPLALWILLPPSAGRARLLRVAVIAAVTSVVLYVVTDRINQAMFGTWTATKAVPRVTEHPLAALLFYIRLYMSGVAVAFAGPWFLALHGLSGWAISLLCAAAVALVAAARPRWRSVAACLLLSAAPYGLIGLARFVPGEGPGVEATLWGRYHYIAPLGLYLTLALALAALLARIRDRRRADAVFAVAGYAAAVTAYLCCFPPVPRFEAVQHDVNRILRQITGTIRAHPPGDVYIRQKPFFISDLASLQVGDEVVPIPPGRFPGTPGLFALYHDDNVVEGRRVYFLVGDPARLRAWQRGRRGSQLILSWQEMEARTGGAAAADAQSPSSGGAAPSTPR